MQINKKANSRKTSRSWRHQRNFLQLFQHMNLEGKTSSRRYILLSFSCANFLLNFFSMAKFFFFFSPIFSSVAHLVVLKACETQPSSSSSSSSYSFSSSSSPSFFLCNRLLSSSSSFFAS